MNEKRFVPSKYAGHTHDVKTDKHYYVTDEYVGCRELFDEIENLEDENEQLRECYKNCKKMLSEAIEENELLECKEGVYNVHRLKKDYQQLKEENRVLRTQLLIFQQSKKDDGQFQVWEVPPIPKGMRIKISTGEKDE